MARAARLAAPARRPVCMYDRTASLHANLFVQLQVERQRRRATGSARTGGVHRTRPTFGSQRSDTSRACALRQRIAGGPEDTEDHCGGVNIPCLRRWIQPILMQTRLIAAARLSTPSYARQASAGRSEYACGAFCARKTCAFLPRRSQERAVAAALTHLFIDSVTLRRLSSLWHRFSGKCALLTWKAGRVRKHLQAIGPPLAVRERVA